MENSEVAVTNGKRERFVALCEKRVSRAIETLRLIHSLTNTSFYEYTEKDFKKIKREVNKEIKKLGDSFKNRKHEGNYKFKL